MNTQKLRQLIADAISKRPPSELMYYHICWWEKRIQCLPARHTHEKHDIFFGADDETFKNGLSLYQHKLIESRILDFCAGRKITPDPASDKKGADGKKPPKEQEILVTEFDSRRLRTLLVTARNPGSSMEGPLSQLQHLLEEAEVVAPESISPHVVTMNSKLRLKDYKSGDDMVVSLVFPSAAVADKSFEELKVSVLSPIGLSVFGRKVGQRVSDDIRVQEILFQPEAMGRFDL